MSEKSGCRFCPIEIGLNVCCAYASGTGRLMNCGFYSLLNRNFFLLLFVGVHWHRCLLCK